MGITVEIIEDQCPSCLRTFNPDALKRHIPICNKVNRKVRKPMNMQRQRLQGTEMAGQRITTKPEVDPPKSSNWKEKHEEFIRSIRYARAAKAAEQTGAPIPAPPPSKKPSDFVECPTCGRSFNPSSAERHISFCAEQAKRRPATTSKTKAAAAARRDKMKNFKSTFDKKREKVTNNSNVPSYSPQKYTSVSPTPHPHSADMKPIRFNNNNTDERVQRRVPSHQNQARNRVREVTSAKSVNNANSRHVMQGSATPPFCYNCGAKYPIHTAKFCCECGSRRLANNV